MIILISILLGWMAPAHAQDARPQNQCLELFSYSLGELRSDFAHTTKVDVELKDTMPIKDQCGLPLCHLYSWAYELENRTNIPISIDYLDAAYIYHRAEWAIDSGMKSFADAFGNSAIISRDHIRQIGLMPEGVWKANANFNDRNVVLRLTETIQNIIINAKSRREAMVSDQVSAQVLDAAVAEMKEYLDSVIGRPPEKFMYKGKEYTPITFAETFFPEFHLPVITASVVTNFKLATLKDMGAYKEASISIEQAEALAKELIDSGRPALFSYEHNRQYVDLSTGIMSVDAFYFGQFSAPLPRQKMDQWGRWQNSHSIMVVGYELDAETGLVKKWKLKNSWGESRGDGGYFYMYRDFFTHYISAVSYTDDGTITPVNRVIKAFGP